jgi:hypothetical protein
MSYRVENSQEELDLLKGATILDVRIVPVAGPDDDPAFQAFAAGEDKILMSVRLARPVHVENDKGKVVTTDTVNFEVWQDEEGNGPGYIALVG